MKAVDPASRRGAVLTMMAVITLVTATAIAHVWTHLSVIDHGYRISKATTRQDQLFERNRRLRVELAVLKDPARVAKLAAGRLGMRASEPRQVRRIRLDGRPLPGWLQPISHALTAPSATPIAPIIRGDQLDGRHQDHRLAGLVAAEPATPPGESRDLMRRHGRGPALGDPR